MAHPRQAIRDAFAALLVAANTAAGNNVFANRQRPFRLAELPGLALYTTEEEIDGDSRNSSPTVLRRILSLNVEVGVKAINNPDDEMDALCQEVENVAALNETLGGLVASGPILTKTEIDLWTDGSNQQYVIATMTFEIEYDTDWPSADAQPLDDLTLVHAETRVQGNLDGDDTGQVTEVVVPTT